MSLGTLLIGVNTALVLMAVICVVFAGMGLLRRLADEQALARVGLAGRGALQAVQRSAGDVSTSAHLLGERPTVGRLLQAGDAAGLAAFLERFRQTSRLTGCAIVVAGQPRAIGGPPLPWAEILGTTGKTPAPLRLADGSLVLAASAPVTWFPGATAAVALRLDAAFARAVGDQVGLPVAILHTEDALARADDPRYDLRSRTLEEGVASTGRLDDAGVYLSVLPLVSPAGGVTALVETSLPTAPVASSLSALVRTLLLLSLWVAALATLAGFLISRRLARPVRALTVAAERIGRGDLSTPAPRASGAELGTLASTMEDMRRRLLRLTSELTRRQAEGEAILTGIVEGVFSVDRDRRIRYLNPQAAALLGLESEDVVGRFCGDVLNPQGPDGVRPCAEHCPILHARFRGGTTATEHLLLADGSRRDVVITSAPPAEDHQFQVMRDETDLEAARRLRDSVLANVSHEFRTPLSAQLASIELLRDRLQQGSVDPQVEGLVLSLERGTLRLTQLIDNLLESVRIESGQLGIRQRPVALDEVVEEAVELTSPLIAQRGQRLEVDLPYPLPMLQGDAPRLTQVFVNLLANANKFAPAGSAIRVGGEVGESAVSLWVEDEGPGLPAGETGERSLFGRFVRSSGDEEPEQTGMGLGLWIVQSIVERHGGRVEAGRAAAPGSGTRLRVVFPLGPLGTGGEPS